MTKLTDRIGELSNEIDRVRGETDDVRMFIRQDGYANKQLLMEAGSAMPDEKELRTQMETLIRYTDRLSNLREELSRVIAKHDDVQDRHKRKCVEILAQLTRMEPTLTKMQRMTNAMQGRLTLLADLRAKVEEELTR